MKEIEYNKEHEAICPYCKANVNQHINNAFNIIWDTDVEKVENGEYGIQARWKEVFECPSCREHFFIICEH